MTPRLLSFLLPCLLCLPWFSLGAEIAKPNVILFLADDMGMGDTSAYQDFTGNADDVQLATPNLDRLARMGVRFTDAHTPASRCTTTRYALLTGRYAWRSRMKYWVLFGSQGDPLIERDRPTLATLFRDAGYGTAMVGKWHVGLRYTRSDDKPAAGWEDADLSKPLYDGPLDHGFDYARFTSRSHGTSGPDAGDAGDGKKKRKSGPDQDIGPGHIHGREIVGATGNGKELVKEGPNAYVLTKLGSRHSDHAIEYLDTHLAGGGNESKPFFLYYPSNSNHAPYTPTDAIAGVPVKGAARTKSGRPMDARHDYIYENDVAVGRLLDYLEANDDPRHPGKKLIETTLVIFTSDNGAEKDSKVATGPFRSHKGSCFEGGHRVPFLVAWGAGGIGDGDAETAGATSDAVMGLTDLYATFFQILENREWFRPQAEEAVTSGNDFSWMRTLEDGCSLGPLWRNPSLAEQWHPPLFVHDHKEQKSDPAVAAMRLDSPRVEDRVFEGKWKIFFDAALIRKGEARPFALYELGSDQEEKIDRLAETDLAPLVEHLKKVAIDYRTAGGYEAMYLYRERVLFDWQTDGEGGSAAELNADFLDQSTTGVSVTRKLDDGSDLVMTVSSNREDRTFRPNFRGLGIGGGDFDQVDSGEALLISFDRDVLLESASIVAGNGTCGGFYRVGEGAPQSIYCIDGDIDDKDQSGILSDLGILPAGQTLRLDSSPHLGVESPGGWRLGALRVRTSNSLSVSF